MPKHGKAKNDGRRYGMMKRPGMKKGSIPPQLKKFVMAKKKKAAMKKKEGIMKKAKAKIKKVA